MVFIKEGEDLGGEGSGFYVEGDTGILFQVWTRDTKLIFQVKDFQGNKLAVDGEGRLYAAFLPLWLREKTGSHRQDL